ncbi:hypothetical protein MYCTH_2124673 [Thermothelomyces thermophilus ATCC 42464]|uniref:Glucose-methanol-choline oxidoreductase C-terminal domain-containing protein n=1 Tax=Thermothelomyces thermophilus (strain ATCC 42464 / BCRC 31852 / DSM 1799) TaxID=573729 RepID=G2PZN0_THET4|nr:uncharacterized protein MYCTH_2124673 [Thermothelomyces thermophilus ATCC 42464]AEO55716.1 hypothetical protein MYCTH_2124673 [Thermothelomyces thermophilus ATCC 42464]
MAPYADINMPRLRTLLVATILILLQQSGLAYPRTHHASKLFVGGRGVDGEYDYIVDGKTTVLVVEYGQRTPSVLQLSGIGPRELLESAGILTVVNLPGVGQDFQHHAMIQAGLRFAAYLARSLTPTEYHPAGTRAMLPRDLGGVVDQELRVYGVDRIRGVPSKWSFAVFRVVSLVLCFLHFHRYTA